MPGAPPQTPEEAQREFAETLSGFTAGDNPEYADYSRCIHCGLCLNACPTYRLWHNEADSPRGRIRQMALIDQGRMELGEAFVTHIDRCLRDGLPVGRGIREAGGTGARANREELQEAARVAGDSQFRLPAAAR